MRMLPGSRAYQATSKRLSPLSIRLPSTELDVCEIVSTVARTVERSAGADDEFHGIFIKLSTVCEN